MTPAEKFRTRYSAEDERLLMALRQRADPMPWREIRDRHFPNRTPDALKMKYIELCPSDRPRGRPMGSKGANYVEPDEKTENCNRFEEMVARGTIKLGRAIEAVFGRLAA